MRTKNILSLFLSLAMITSLLPFGTAAAADDPENRLVYVHAGGANPTETVDVSTVYRDETANVYLAVDNPNKSGIENGAFTDPQYNLNGYTVTFYFDPEFFDYADPGSPIDYTVPTDGAGESGSVQVGPDGEPITEAEVGYYIYRYGSGTAEVGGKNYKTAYATIMFSGNFLPQKQEGALWYNLCRLPLKPLKTGSSDVFIAVDSAGNDEVTHQYDLELLAKNSPDEEASPTFTYDVRNSGRHTITITDRSKPAAPIADPPAGSYTEPQSVSLSVTEEGCDIYYSADGGAFVKFDPAHPIEIEYTTTITCYSERVSDGKQSGTVSYTYEILPSPPFLFDESGALLPNSVTEDGPVRVYVSDSGTFGDISDGSEVYYTFSESLDADNPVIADGASDPYTQWVKISKPSDYQYIDIPGTCVVRLITQKGGEFSEAAWYSFNIRPAEVTATPGSGVYDGRTDVALSTQTEGAEIYYTLDGSDPRESGGILYTGTPLTLYKDTTIRAAAKYGGVYGNVSSYYYIFNSVDDFGIDAFYPPGVYEDSVRVTLTPQNPDYDVYYSTDGGVTFEQYSPGEILTFDKNTELIAYAEDENGIKGGQYTFTYKIKPMPPVFAPETTQFTNASKVTVYRTQTDDSYELYYTTDGSDPITNGTKADGDFVEFNITDYTVISAVTVKDGVYSSVVTHTYDIVLTKPVRPLMTLTPGLYTITHEDEPYTTQFMPVPEGTKIYYTISHDGGALADPVPGAEGTIEYIPGSDIELSGHTVIKAVAVNVFNSRSDIGIFDYTIVPAAPYAPPSAEVSGALPVVPVTAVEGSTIIYSVNGVENTFVLEDGTVFYIDTATGNAYKDKDCSELLGSDVGAEISSPAELVIKAELDGVESAENKYTYELADDPESLSPPYADRESGTYDQINSDGENNMLTVYLYHIEDGAEIEYMLNNDGVWNKYDGSGIKLGGDTVLQARALRDGVYSSAASYVYTFEPLPPVISLASGTYSDSQYVTLSIDGRAPSNREYTIMYRRNGDRDDVRYTGAEILVDHTMSLKAYVIDESSGKTSKNAVNYYIIDSASASGTVYVGYPYDQSTRYSSEVITTAPYSEGIKLISPDKDAVIHYYYTYKTEDGKSVTTSNMVYDNTPIIPSPFMTELTITAWLTDSDGTEISGSQKTFPFEFVKLETPKTSLYETGEIEFASGTEYTLINDYPDDENILLYYTLDGSDPSDGENTSRKLYAGEELTITKAVTVKAVYFSACGKCVNCKNGDKANCLEGVYGPIGEYKYTVPKRIYTGGGGTSGSRPGGGSSNPTVDNTRKYTVDIFGNEHPTHIGYISGYPDGSVKADGDITREEIAAVLYRVKNKTYDQPVPTTGDVFPDVKPGRWSISEIEYLTHYDIINGYPDGEFKPENNLTRAEFAALIRRFTELDDADTENVFPDVEEDMWAYEDIMAISKAGLIEGYEDGTFRPENDITRAEVMTIINKILGRNPSEEYVKELNFNPYTDLEDDRWYYVTVLEATITHNYWLDDDGLEIEWEDYK